MRLTQYQVVSPCNISFPFVIHTENIDKCVGRGVCALICVSSSYSRLISLISAKETNREMKLLYCDVAIDKVIYLQIAELLYQFPENTLSTCTSTNKNKNKKKEKARMPCFVSYLFLF